MNGSASSSPSLSTNVRLRIGLLFVLLVSSAVSTALPVLLSLKFSKSVKKDPLWRKLLLSSLNCFAGGVFLGVTFLHLLPNLSRDWDVILSDIWPSKYPFSDFLVVLGFFLILVIEQIAHTWQYGNKKEIVVETSEKPHSERQVAIKRYGSQPNILASLHSLSAEEHILSLKYHSDCNVCEREHRKHKRSASSGTRGLLVYARRDCELPKDPRLHEQSPSNANHQQNTEEVNDATPLLSSAEHQDNSPFPSPDRKGSDNKPVSTSSGSQSSLRALFLAVALSVHSVFEGLAFGVIESDAVAVQVFVGIVIHKTVIGLSLGIAFVTSQSKIWFSFVLTFIFVVSSPVGIAIGLGILTQSSDSTGSLITSAILESLACGTFAYVTFLELIGHEFSNVQSVIARHRLGLVLCAVLGFCLMAGLTFLPG